MKTTVFSFCLILIISSLFCINSYANTITCPLVVICKNDQCVQGNNYNEQFKYVFKFGMDNATYPLHFANGVYVFKEAWSFGEVPRDNVQSSPHGGECMYQGTYMQLSLRSVTNLLPDPKSYNHWSQSQCVYYGHPENCPMIEQ